ncbi:hypothetical protein Q5H93_14500 [Hymenobacter sp. ASUV-10]|uniref:Uncharacterized protein n=1 Tax=Hymenobacter aranciens TaxID=3063996 RepID=A0ABT9BH26_9BACT|nr:hypothetical protein [Hymenobacter sp. ASUV-10]MDO7875951.1 hypothetical protein [Hymenobacter sp. ASUV-10]
MSPLKRIIFTGLTIGLACYYFYSHISEQNCCEIVSEIAKDNGIILFKVCSNPDRVSILENNLSDFALHEQLSVHFQKITQAFYKFKPGEIRYFNRNSNKLQASKIVPNCNSRNDFIYKISVPIVSPDQQTVLLKITQDCNCMLGGQGETSLYRKVNGKWKVVKYFDRWIS